MIHFVREGDVTVVELGSDYDSLDQDALDEVGGVLLTGAVTVEPPLMVVDLSETRFIGSAFIELLVRTWKRLRERDGALVLCGLQPFCAEVLRTTRLDTLWRSFPDRAAAVEAALHRPCSG